MQQNAFFYFSTLSPCQGIVELQPPRLQVWRRNSTRCECSWARRVHHTTTQLRSSPQSYCMGETCLHRSSPETPCLAATIRDPSTRTLPHNLQCSQTHVNVMAPLPPFSHTTCVPGNPCFPTQCPLYRLACFDAFRHLPNSFFRFPRPSWHIFFPQFTVSAYFRYNSTGSMPLDIVDPSIHLNRPVVSRKSSCTSSS